MESFDPGTPDIPTVEDTENGQRYMFQTREEEEPAARRCPAVAHAEPQDKTKTPDVSHLVSPAVR